MVYYGKETMTACITCQRTTELVKADWDAFMLEITGEQIGKICYDCANNQHCLQLTGMSLAEFEDSLYGRDNGDL